MEIESICGCKIQLTAEDLDREMESGKTWLKTKMMEHVLREHRDNSKPMTSAELKALSSAVNSARVVQK